MYLVVIFTILAIMVMITVIWIAYSISAAYQQTITITIPFEETYRYIPNLNKNHKFKLDTIKVTVTGAIKKETVLGSTIVPGSHIKDFINENIIHPYKGCLLIHEANTFIVEENILRRCPIIKNPTLENLSIMFFNKLASIMPKIRCQLVSVKLMSEGLKVTHSRYKMSDYKV